MSARIETLLLLALCPGVIVNGKIVPSLTQVTWEDGRFGYFAVPRERVAAKLAEVQQKNSCHEERLTLPNRTVLPDILTPDQHVVAIVYGMLGAKAIEDSLPAKVKAEYETKAGNVQFFIPFLTGSDPNARPTYKLALGSFVSTTKPFIQPNIAIPTEQVDFLQARPDGLTIVDGCEELDIVWSPFHGCELPDDVVLHDFEEYVDEFTLSFENQNDYSFCDEPGTSDNIFCEELYITDCACQFWTHGRTERCDGGFFSVAHITKKFEEVSLLTDGPQDAVLTELTEGVYGIGAQKPCIE